MGFTVIICMIWWIAYFNNDRVMVTINMVGERNFEMVLGFVLIPMMVYGFYWFLKDFAAKKRRLRKSVAWFMSLEKEETL